MNGFNYYSSHILNELARQDTRSGKN